MIVADTPLWFDSCAADSAVTLMIVGLAFGIILLLAKVAQSWLPSRNGRSLTTSLVWSAGGCVILLSLAYLIWPFPPQIVRIVLSGDSVDIKVCRTWSQEGGKYALNDVHFRYVREERGSKKIVHHMLVAQVRGEAEPLGEMEIVPGRSGVDFAALGQLAPEALEQYEGAGREKRRY